MPPGFPGAWPVGLDERYSLRGHVLTDFRRARYAGHTMSLVEAITRIP
jgi:hypothetical protein